MSQIHTCQLCEVNSFDYLTELLRHHRELAANPRARIEAIAFSKPQFKRKFSLNTSKF
jgi:hypothetical protein